MSGTVTLSGADALRHYGVFNPEPAGLTPSYEPNEVMAGLVRKREAERVKLLGEIKRVGMDKFAEIFYSMVQKQEYPVNPEEFFSQNSDFKEICMKLQKEFYLALFRAILPRAQPEEFASTLSCLGEGDFPKRELLTILDDTPPPLVEDTNTDRPEEWDWNSLYPICNKECTLKQYMENSQK